MPYARIPPGGRFAVEVVFEMAYPLDVTYLGTYPPRRCGIATFTRDLAQAVGGAARGSTRIVAMNAPGETYAYPPEVGFQIRRDRLDDYRRAAEWINDSSADVLSVQHEFGLFGGQAGSHLSALLRRVAKPVVATLHTVLKDPLPEYEAATRELVELSDVLAVMSRVAREILISRYGVPEEKIALIYHGTPDMARVDGAEAKRRLGLEGRFVVLTFGLLSQNKGIETAIEALPPVAAERPDLLYVVLGATHPEVKKREGERYRESLQEKARALSVEENVRFVDQFVELETLMEYIAASDLYVTPYLHREQVVSGTLSYALAAGKAIISTPYWHAEELLSEGRGVLVPFRDPEALSKAMLSLIGEPERLEAVRRAAFEFGRQMVWPEVGKAYAALFERVKKTARASRNGSVDGAAARREKAGVAAALQIPEVKLDHLKALTDDTGLIQHATYGVPDRRFGYSSDDAGRALVALLELEDDPAAAELRDEIEPLIARYVSFLQHAQTESGHFHNFMAYDRSFLDTNGSDDTLGRVVWGLGRLVASRPWKGAGALARSMLERALERVGEIRSPRAWAYVICGLAAALRRLPEHEGFLRPLRQTADKLWNLYQAQSAPDWPWFEERITYGNAKMSEALLLAYEATGEERYKEAGLASLDFLIQLCWNGSYFDLIGNQGWAERGRPPAVFSQQPIDAGYLVEACDTACRVAGEERYLRYARSAFEWFLGDNRMGAPLYDEQAGAVSDGIDPHGLSQNQGAESAVCFLLALGRMRRRFVPEGRKAEADGAVPKDPAATSGRLGGGADAARAERSI